MRSRISRSKIILGLGCVVLLAYAGWAQAIVTCNVSSTGFPSIFYSALAPTINITSATFDVACSRDNAAGPPNSNVQYQVAVTSASGFVARGPGGATLNYFLATDINCTIPWQGTTYIPATAASFPLAKGASATFTYTYYACIAAGQTVGPAGTYTDNPVTMAFSTGTATGGASSFTGGSFSVNIIAPASCSLTSSPVSDIVFAYTSFSPVAVPANSAFTVNCTSQLPYTMALDATTGTIPGLNLNYTLGLDTAANTAGFNPLASTGIGTNQTFYINGNIAAGQGGTCSGATCSGSQSHTLTISY